MRLLVCVLILKNAIFVHIPECEECHFSIVFSSSFRRIFEFNGKSIYNENKFYNIFRRSLTQFEYEIYFTFRCSLTAAYITNKNGCFSLYHSLALLRTHICKQIIYGVLYVRLSNCYSFNGCFCAPSLLRRFLLWSRCLAFLFSRKALSAEKLAIAVWEMLLKCRFSSFWFGVSFRFHLNGLFLGWKDVFEWVVANVFIVELKTVDRLDIRFSPARIILSHTAKKKRY